LKREDEDLGFRKEHGILYAGKMRAAGQEEKTVRK
jgi:hypothetical protein